MKQNVDLTENRMFSTTGFDSLLVTVFPNLRPHPWNPDHFRRIYSDKDIEHNNSMIICGNATEREAKRFNLMLDYGHICECCGAELVKPWAKHYSLCERCSSYLDITCQKLWRYKDDPIQDSRDRLVIEMNRR